MLPLPTATLAACALIVLAAGVVRGFSGFGFSALCVAGLSVLLPPAQVVPPIFALEVLASLSLLRQAWRDADWPWLAWLVAGNALCIPLGLLALAWVPEVPMRGLLAALLLLAAGLLRAGVNLGLAPTRGMRLVTGLVSGFVNGVAAIGGMAVAVLLSGTGLAPAALRGTMIVLFLFTDLYALMWAGLMTTGAAGATTPLLGAGTWWLAAWLAPAMLVGIWIGQRAFTNVSQDAFRRAVLNLLMGIALLTAARAGWAWLAA